MSLRIFGQTASFNGEIRGDRVQQQLVGESDLDAVTAAKPGAHATLSGEQDGGQYLTPRAPRSTAWRWAPAMASSSVRGSTLPKGIGTSLFRGCALDDFGDAVGFVLGLGPGVDGQDDAAMFQFAVLLGDRSRDGVRSSSLKYFAEVSVRTSGS